jgi:hypothetical protein
MAIFWLSICVADCKDFVCEVTYGEHVSNFSRLCESKLICVLYIADMHDYKTNVNLSGVINFWETGDH